jgi:hypothetical protein
MLCHFLNLQEWTTFLIHGIKKGRPLTAFFKNHILQVVSWPVMGMFVLDFFFFFFFLGDEHLGMEIQLRQDVIVQSFSWVRDPMASQIELIYLFARCQDLYSKGKRAAHSALKPHFVGMGQKLWEKNSHCACMLVSMAMVIKVWAKVNRHSKVPTGRKDNLLLGDSQKLFFLLP